MSRLLPTRDTVIPAQAGIQCVAWIPSCTGMTVGAGMMGTRARA